MLELPIVDSVSPRPPYLPPAVPADLVDRIARLHGDPIVWWVSQFLKYMLRPQPHLRAMLKATVENFKFEHPIVGIHIRRTDKVTYITGWMGMKVNFNICVDRSGLRQLFTLWRST